MAKKTRQQPLRGTAHVKKDIADTYQKNEGTRKIHITEEEPVKAEEQAQDVSTGSVNESKEKKEPKIKFDEAPADASTNSAAEAEEAKTDNASTNSATEAKSDEPDPAALKDQLIRKNKILSSMEIRIFFSVCLIFQIVLIKHLKPVKKAVLTRKCCKVSA
jgi:hypothetical protein